MLLVSCRTTDDAMHFNLAEAEEDFSLVGWRCRANVVPGGGPTSWFLGGDDGPGLQTKERERGKKSKSFFFLFFYSELRRGRIGARVLYLGVLCGRVMWTCLCTALYMTADLELDSGSGFAGLKLKGKSRQMPRKGGKGEGGRDQRASPRS